MMNILTISLVLTTLVTAGLFNEKKEQDHVIVEEGGHRVVVVEYVNDDGTKVSISPQDHAATPQDHAASGYVSDVKNKLREKAEEASSVLPNIGQGISVDDHNRPSARDVVCDAFGKCKHKIATAFGKTKDTVEEDAKEAFVKTKEAASDKVDQFKQGAADKVDDVKETAAKVKGKAKDVIETTKGKMKEEVYDMAKKVEEKAEQGKDFVKEGAERVKEEGRKELKEILQLGREFFSGVFAYMLRPVMRLAHLLGFAVAYGMCIWVTFISSFVLARALPRHQFAVVQSKIYPVYFKAMAYSVGAAFLGHLLSQKQTFYANSSEAIQGFNLLASVAMLLVNLLYFEPRATKVMFERLKLEKEEGRGVDILDNNVEPSSRGVDTAPAGAKTTTHPTTPAPAPAPAVNVDKSAQVVRLSQKLKKLNSYSSFLNVLTLMALTHHLVHITQLVDT